MSDVVEKYGLPFPASWEDWQIELACMTHNHLPKNGGLGMHGHLRNAMMELWPDIYKGEVQPGIPKWRDEIELMTWAWCHHRRVSVIGHASAAKTHTFGHIGAAMFIADAPNTILTLTSTHLPGLRRRLWADVVSAFATSRASHLFEPRHHDMTIRPTGTKEDKYIVTGIATDRGQEAVEKIQGNHSRNHNLVIIDEAQGTPEAIFEATANLSTDPDFRIAKLANPTKKFSPFGTWCEPEGGWGKVDPETDLWWTTKRGGVCIRLDGARSPNIKHGRTIFPFLIRQDYVDSLEKSFGRGSPRWWTFYRGWFAPDGALGIVVPPSLLHRAEQLKVFNFKPRRIAALDPAFEGGDQCMLSFADYSPDFDMNLVSQVPVKVVVKENGDPMDYLIAMETIRLCKENGVESADDLIIDTTGAGRSVAAFIDREWGKVQRCGFGGAPTDRPVKKGDNETCDQLFDRFVSELWWMVRVFLEENMVGGLTEKFNQLREDLSAREYETAQDKKIRVERKVEMKERLGRSPDAGDSFAMLIELIRRRGAVAGRNNPAANRVTPNKALMKRAIAFSKIIDPRKEFSHG